MIRGLHGLFYSSEVDAMRAYLRDVLRLPFTDVGEGWLIFDLPEADIGVHPVEAESESGKHDVSFYCNDIEGTVRDLRSRGAVFDTEIADHGYGFVTYFTMPGNVRVQLYEPKYKKRATARAARPSRKQADGARTARAGASRRAKGGRAKPAARAASRAKPATKAAKRPPRTRSKSRAKARARRR
jgi:hypothetical protein